MTSPRKRKTALIYLAAANFGKFDAYLPLLVHLASISNDANLALFTIMPFRQGQSQLRKSPMHYEAARRLSHYFPPLQVPLAGVLSILLLIALLFWQRALGHNRIVLTQWSPKSKLEQMILLLVEKLAILYRIPALQTPMTPAMAERFKNWHMLQELNIKPVRSKPNGGYRYKNGLCWLPSEITDANQGYAEKQTAIGLARLYPSWKRFLSLESVDTLSQTLEEAGLPPDLLSFGVVILTNPDYFWFPNGRSDYPEMLSNIIAASRKYFPGLPILLKPKPQSRDLFERLLREYDICAEDVKLIDVGLSTLTARASWAATINESSGVMDFLCTDVPTVEYSRYSQTWLDISPSGSAWRGTPGLTYVLTTDELDEFFAGAARELTYDIRSRLAEYFGHREDLSILDVI